MEETENESPLFLLCPAGASFSAKETGGVLFQSLRSSVLHAGRLTRCSSITGTVPIPLVQSASDLAGG